MLLSFTAIAFLKMGAAIIFASLKLKRIKVGIEKVKSTSKEKIVDIQNSIEKAMNDDNADLKSIIKELKGKIDEALD